MEANHFFRILKKHVNVEFMKRKNKFKLESTKKINVYIRIHTTNNRVKHCIVVYDQAKAHILQI